MNPLPRLLGFGLILVLASLVALLTVPELTRPSFSKAGSPPAMAAPHPPSAAAAASVPPSASRRPLQLTAVAHRLAFPLSLLALVLAVALFASLFVRLPRLGDSRPPFAVTRTEVGALAKLAETSNAQSAALAHERDVRQRAEADALLNQQLLNRSLEEKIRLGRDLHDGIIQSLYAAGLTIESARALYATDPAEADRRLARCRENLNQSIRDVRAYIVGLAPANVRQMSFAQALQSLVDELGAGRDVQFDLRIDDSATTQLSPEQSTETLQIAREAISNSLRHGGASRIEVRLHPGDGAICLLVRDDGRGFDPARRDSRGHGVGNMTARAEHLGGDLRFESAPGQGTRVVFTLPLGR
jgi:signal transduction histidine kinase